MIFKNFNPVFIPLLAAAFFLSGCTIRKMRSSSPVPEERIARLSAGMAKAQVLELLGPPDDAGLRMDGSVFIYRFHNKADKALELSFMQGSFNYEESDWRTHRVVVFFDKQGIVTDFAAYTEKDAI